MKPLAIALSEQTANTAERRVKLWTNQSIKCFNILELSRSQTALTKFI
jgi:hypothetical protein